MDILPYMLNDFRAGCGTVYQSDGPKRLLFKRQSVEPFMSTYGVLSIPEEDVDGLKKDKTIKLVKIYDQSTHLMYICKADEFRKSKDVRFVSQRAGSQVCVPIEKFTVEEK